MGNTADFGRPNANIGWKMANHRLLFLALHRVCSLHFKDGKKMGTTDIPKLFPLLPKPTFRKPPKDRSACNVISNAKQSLEPVPETLGSGCVIPFFSFSFSIHMMNNSYVGKQH